MKRLLLAPEAEIELAEAWRYYEERQSGLGDLLLADFEAACGRIERNPVAWAYHYRHYRRHLLDQFPYGIVYTIEENCLWGIAVMHLARRPHYWKYRKRKVK